MIEEDPKLESCPFCGPDVDEHTPTCEHEIKGSRYWCVWCPHCDFYGPLFLTKPEVAKHWNRRQ